MNCAWGQLCVYGINQSSMISDLRLYWISDMTGPIPGSSRHRMRMLTNIGYHHGLQMRAVVLSS